MTALAKTARGPYPGVTRHKRRFRAQAEYHGRKLYLGLYPTEAAAAAAYERHVEARGLLEAIYRDGFARVDPHPGAGLRVRMAGDRLREMTPAELHGLAAAEDVLREKSGVGVRLAPQELTAGPPDESSAADAKLAKL